MTASQIAIVGMACRLPGAPGVQQFWANLCAGVESIRRLSRDELLEAGLTPEDLGAPRHVPYAAIIEDADRFDAGFFGMTGREAELMDPQHRIFLECAWEALEHAGYDPARISGSVGVFGGANFNTYLTRNLIPADVFEDKSAILQAVLANDKDYLATRVAYKLNLRGPACTVQSGCSTSLVAVQLAAQSLLNFQCDMALAGGVAVDPGRAQGYWAYDGSVFSPDGHVRAFDAQARGTVFGNGVALVVLKRLDQALQDGDTVYAVILGSAVNNDGSVKVGFTAPSVAGQSEVIAEALGDAGVEPESIGYVETHGTGTSLGDPVEIEALTKVFGGRPAGFARCAIGSVKTNIGHLDSAAGVASLIKTVLALHHRALPPSLNFTEPSPTIAFERTPFYVNTSLAEWTAGTRAGLPRRAGVSSFGMGGTNAHVVVEAAVMPPSDPPSRSYELLVWSARSAGALERATGNLAAYLRSDACGTVADVAYTLQAGRPLFEHRRFLVCRDPVEAATALERLDDTVRTHQHDGEVRPVAFLFTGRRVPPLATVRALYDAEPAFREAIDGCRRDCLTDAGIDLAAVLSGAGQTPPTDSRAADLAAVAVGYALAQLWQSWGVVPAVVLGHGIGEIAAAGVAGALARRDALRLVDRCARLGSDVALAGLLDGISLAPAKVPLVSQITGRELDLQQAADLTNWLEGLRHPGPIEETIEALAARGVCHRLELGPDGANEQALLETLGDLWQGGISVNWEGVHAGRRRRRVPLPSYPFERTRFWIDPPDEEPEPSSDAAAARKRLDPAQWLYVPAWQQTPAVELLRPAGPDPRTCDWLVLADDTPLAACVVTSLVQRASPDRVTVVDRAHAEAVDYAALLPEHAERPLVVVHMWSLSARDDAGGPRDIAAAQHCGLYSLLHLARAMSEKSPGRRTSVRIITANAQDVLGDEPLALGATPLFAAARVLPQEHPAVDCACVDVSREAATHPARVDALAARIVAELTAAIPEPFVAYRGASRWVQRYEPLPVARHAADHPRVRDGGTYLILGGLGRIGLTLADHLARSAKVNLVLAGRTALPERDTWPGYLDRAHETDPVAFRIRRVLALEDLGARVLVQAVDAGDENGMTSTIAAVDRRFGRLDGVIAAAGVIDAQAFRPMAALTPEECERQFWPKVSGLFALERALGDRPLDFCLVISSLSSVLGGLGYGAYAAANIFMDAFVRRHNRSHPVRWMSANWDAWTWREVHDDVPGVALTRLALTPTEAAAAFDRLLSAGPVDQVVIAASSLEARVAQWVGRVGARGSRAGAAPGAAPSGESGDRPAPSVEPAVRSGSLTATQRVVLDVWARVLGLAEIELSDTFLDLGGNSLTAIQAIHALEQALGIHLAIEEFIFQTAAQLATLCDGKMAMREQEPAPVAPVPKGLFQALRDVLVKS